MAGNENGNGNGMKNWILGIVAGLVIIGVASLMGLVILLSSRVSSLETTLVSQNNLILSLVKRVDKVEGDFYRPVFGRAKPTSYAVESPAVPRAQ